MLGLVAAAAAIMFVAPDGGSSTVEASSTDETPLPLATASMLNDDGLNAVDVSLGASESLSLIHI